MDGDGAVNFLLDKYNKVKQAMLVKIEVSTHSDAYVFVRISEQPRNTIDCDRSDEESYYGTGRE